MLTAARGGCATARFAAATRFAAVATMTSTTEQAVSATVARATTARLGSTTAARLGSTTAARLGSTSAARLRSRARRFRGSATAARFCFTAAAVMTTAEELSEASIGLAFQHHRHADQGRHTNGSTQHKILSHRKSSKRNQKHIFKGNRRGSSAPPNVTKSLLIAAAADRDHAFSRICKKRLPEKRGRLGRQVGSRWDVKIYRLSSLRSHRGLGGIT